MEALNKECGGDVDITKAKYTVARMFVNFSKRCCVNNIHVFVRHSNAYVGSQTCTWSSSRRRCTWTLALAGILLRIAANAGV